MRFYGQVKGRRHGTDQPEPMLPCPACGRKRPEGEFLDAQGKMLAFCVACRAKQSERNAGAKAKRTAAKAEKEEGRRR